MNDFDRPILAIIPCRGGSRGIPRKALQPIAGVPLLLRTLQTVANSHVAERIVVSTEDTEFAAFARLRGFEVLDRPAALAEDDVPIADVVRHAVEALEWDGLTAVFQPTCPLLTSDTIVSFVEQFRQLGFDWAIAGTKTGHIHWQDGRPLTGRHNRQKGATDARSLWRESGAIQMMTSAYALTGKGIRTILEIPEAEALDIDTHADLEAARATLSRRNIHFRVAAGHGVGSGHFWRCLRLSEALSRHQITWSFPGTIPKWAQEKLESRCIKILDSPRPWTDMVIIDALDAAEHYAAHDKAMGAKVVVFEHDGPAVKFSDLVVDEFADPYWTILRSEFMCLPERTIREKGARILVTFGGTDPAGLNQRIGSMLAYAIDAEVRIAAGPGCDINTASLASVVKDAHMAEEMCWADLVITGQGRTVAEAIACGTPVISIAQNERESRHARLPGVLYLGLWAAVSDEAFIRTVDRLIDRPSLRAEMSATARAAIDGKGLQRVVRKIEELLDD